MQFARSPSREQRELFMRKRMGTPTDFDGGAEVWGATPNRSLVEKRGDIGVVPFDCIAGRETANVKRPTSAAGTQITPQVGTLLRPSSAKSVLPLGKCLAHDTSVALEQRIPVKMYGGTTPAVVEQAIHFRFARPICRDFSRLTSRSQREIATAALKTSTPNAGTLHVHYSAIDPAVRGPCKWVAEHVSRNAAQQPTEPSLCSCMSRHKQRWDVTPSLGDEVEVIHSFLQTRRSLSRCTTFSKSKRWKDD